VVAGGEGRVRYLTTAEISRVGNSVDSGGGSDGVLAKDRGPTGPLLTLLSVAS
jgi:hypothetical protein